MFEDDETLRMYVEESLDHLSEIESDLLTIEEGGKDVDVDLVNNVFRAAHSIKGGAGFMGLTSIKELSHSLENVLGLIRNLELTPDPNKISVLLKGFDQLESLLNNVDTSNETDISDHLQALEEITRSGLPEAEQETVTELVDIVLPDGRIFPEVSLYEINKLRDEGKNLFVAEYDLIKDIHRKNKKPIQLISNLEKTGTLVDSRIDFESAGTLEDKTPPSRIPFQILFASIIEHDMTETLFEIEQKYIHYISDDNIAKAGDSDIKKAGQFAVKKEENNMDTVDQVSNAGQTASGRSAEAGARERGADSTAAQNTAGNSGTENKTESESQQLSMSSKAQSSLRVNVNLLDTLMNLAGELVLSRNQLLQGITSSNNKATEQSSQRIDMITSELQEAIMKTRMQPIANVLNKFTRIVRDMSRELNKSIELDITGKEVELDKTILESINDPLTHLVRNSVDHGIEPPEVREQIGKEPTGTIKLKAFHDAGQVNIVISDDGKGLDPDKIAETALSKGLVTENQIAEMSRKEKTELIFKPGFSTAEKVTDVSGRGVGMDVVVTNIEALGGIIELDSTVGKGTDIQIKLPLTLAIIPSQITAVGNEKYAVPQVNLDELLRIPASQVKHRVEKVGDAAVVRLRGQLLPLLNLSDILGIQKTYTDPETGEEKPDRRTNVADRRSRQLTDEDAARESEQKTQERREDGNSDRRYRADSALNIAVVSAGSFKYGLVVDELLDSEEIVVKPVGRHLKKCDAYAGATIMGDGKVALILDISSLAQMAELNAVATKKTVQKEMEKAEDSGKDKAAMLTFRNAETEYFAAPLNLVERIERFDSSTIEEVGDRKVIQYRGGSLPLYEISQVADVKPLPSKEQQEVIVFRVKGRELGLMVTPPVDALEVVLDVDESTLKQPSISGSMIINEKTTLLIDIFEFIKRINPDWFEKDAETREHITSQGEEKTILFAEDSAFFRKQVKSFMTEDGFKVLEAEDGRIAYELLKERADEIDLVVTDLEMPNMDGFELTEKIKQDPSFSHLSVIALTSLASEAHIEKGKKAGIDEYEIKLDREKLMQIIKQYLHLA
ncbi:MAG: chemotaxis protein CheW [Thermodesulfobacteriota bacterium]